mgnify:CR=1 FL=1
MEVGWRGIGVVVLLLAVLGGAIAYSLWPDDDDAPGPAASKPAVAAAPDEKKKTLAEQLEELEQRSSVSYPDAGVFTLTGVVNDEDGRAVANAEVWVESAAEPSLLEALTCETCGLGLVECTSPSSVRQLLELARAGRLAPKRIATTTSDAAGRFTFAGLPARETMIHARAAGHGRRSEIVDPAFSDAMEPLVLELLAQPSRLITVVDPEDKPVSGAKVAMFDVELGTVTDVTTDGAGRFDAKSPGAGAIRLFVEAAGFLPAVREDTSLWDEVSDDGASVLRLDRPHRLRVETRLSGQLVDAQVEVSGLDHPHLTLAKGGIAFFEDLPAGSFEVLATYQTYVSPKQYVDVVEGDAVVRVDLRPAARLSVAVLDEKGEPVNGARVSVDGYGNTELLITDESGAVLVFDHLAEGAYQVHVEASGLRDAQRRVDLKAGDNHLDVTLQAASMLSGVVVDSDGKPVPSATVELVSQIHEALATTSDEEGKFELQVDEPGEYRLRARETQLGTVIAQVTAPASGLTLKLETLARVDVKVLADKNPLKGAYVTVFGIGASADDSGTAVTDERGVARVAGLHGGEYMINIEQAGFQRPDQQPVKVAANARTEVTLSLERGVEIKGRVVDESGKPVPNADVHTVLDETERKDVASIDAPSAYTDENGEFFMEGLTPGRSYALAASADDRATKGPTKVKAPATGVTLKLQPLPSVKGRVLDETGKPMAVFTVDGKEFHSPDGRFTIGREPDPEGKLYLNVDADGYETLVVDTKYAADLGDLQLKKAPVVRGVVLDATGQPVSGADVTCDQCIDAAVSGSDGSFSLAVSSDSPEPTVSAAKLNHRGSAKVTGAAPVVVKLQPPVRVEGIVKDPTGRPIQARITVREINGAEEERLDSGPDGRFELDLPEGLWMFITRMSSTGQTVRVTAPKVFVTLGAPPGTCAVTITVSEPVGDAWLVPGEPERVPLEQLDDDALYAGAVALDLPLPNRPTRSAGLQCGVYTLITTDSSGVRRERVDVRASEAMYLMPPGVPQAPPQTAEVAGPTQPGQP